MALARLGGECVFASELKETLRRLYAVNFPGVPICGDITTIDINSIPEHDVLCAGFPCQPFSHAGKKEGFNDAKGRGNLFDYICNIAAIHRPRFLFLENVAHLKRHDNGNTWRIMRSKLEALNYYVPDPPLLSPHQFGIPQHRRRIYIICENMDYGHLEHFSYPEPIENVVCDINTIIDKDDKNVRPIQQENAILLMFGKILLVNWQVVGKLYQVLLFCLRNLAPTMTCPQPLHSSRWNNYVGNMENMAESSMGTLWMNVWKCCRNMHVRKSLLNLQTGSYR